MTETRTWQGSISKALGLFLAVPPVLLSLDGCSSASPVTFGSGSPEELQIAADISFRELQVRIPSVALDARRDLSVSRVKIDELAMAHTRVQQAFKGVPVFGGEAIVHLYQDGTFASMTDNLIRGIPVDLDVKPALEPEVAIDQVVGEYDCAECLTSDPTADLFVLRHEGQLRLVYRVSLFREDGTEHTSMPVVFVDAHTGVKVWEYDNLQTVTGTGTSLYSGTLSIDTYLKSGVYYMEDIARKVGTFDNRNTTGSTYRFTDADNNWNSTSQKAGVDAHYGAAKTYDYYKNVLGRTGINGGGGPGYYTSADGVTKVISSKTHYGVNYNNAFWNGSYMTYGDGNGSTFSPLVTTDIAGHEMTHGVTQFEANLTYSGESGALNESMSDVFGAMVERYAKGESAKTWKIGEECYTPANGTNDALRYMDNPHLASNGGYTADDDPDHYSERYTGTADNGGVHINSGIGNKAFYLLAKGGTHHLGGSVTGIGPDDAAKIWYRALANYMTSSTNFAGARTATLSAAADLFGSGSAQYNSVAAAWTAVGVGTGGGGGGGGCAHDKCVIGVALTSGCDPCVTTICNADPYCCSTEWDNQCVGEVSSICGLGC